MNRETYWKSYKPLSNINIFISLNHVLYFMCQKQNWRKRGWFIHTISLCLTKKWDELAHGKKHFHKSLTPTLPAVITMKDWRVCWQWLIFKFKKYQNFHSFLLYSCVHFLCFQIAFIKLYLFSFTCFSDKQYNSKFLIELFSMNTYSQNFWINGCLM